MDFSFIFVLKYMGRYRVYNIEVGEKFYWSDRNLYHIVHIFNDEDDTMVVMKFWNKYRKNWHYETVHKELVEWWLSSNCFKEVNK